MEPSAASGFRVEHDSLGQVRVPSSALWQAQTQRAVENFAISGERVHPEVIRSLLLIKRAAAQSNGHLGVVSADVADAIRRACDLLLQGDLQQEFPVDVFQTGSGTSTNMNVNEVISTLASKDLGQRVHPNDHVNASQSSNDVFPTAVHIAVLTRVERTLIPSLQNLLKALRLKQTDWAGVVKAGRTHLMDAVPVTLGQEFGGYATAVSLGIDRVQATQDRVSSLPLGGTAVGTGLNAPPEFASLTIMTLSHDLGLSLHEATDHFEAQGGQDSLVECSGACRVVAISLNKIASDLRWMSSGPAAGLGELSLPALQPGSSIMPAKVNPVIPEVVHQVVAQVIGNDAAIGFAGASGNFELNVMIPVMARNLLESIDLLSSATLALSEKCVRGSVAHESVLLANAERSSALVTALVPLIGYEAASRIAQKAQAEGSSIRDELLNEGLLTPTQIEFALDLMEMTQGRSDLPDP